MALTELLDRLANADIGDGVSVSRVGTTGSNPSLDTSQYDFMGFGKTAATAAPTAAPATGFTGFGGLGGAATTAPAAGTSLFGGLGGNALGGATAGGLGGFGATQPAPAAAQLMSVQPQVALTAKIDSKPWGSTPLFDEVPDSVIKRVSEHPAAVLAPAPSRKSDSKKSPMVSTMTKTAPAALTRAKLRMAGFHQTSSTVANKPALAPGMAQQGQSNGGLFGASIKALSTSAPAQQIMPPSAFTPRSTVKKLDVRSTEPRAVLQGGASAAAAPPAFTDSTFSESELTRSVLETPSKPPRATGPVLAKPNVISTAPYIMTPDQLAKVKNLTIEHPEFGVVEFLEPVDLRDIPIADLCGKYVLIKHGEFELFPDAPRTPRGKGLNVRAKVTLRQMWPRRRGAREIVKDTNTKMAEAFLKRLMNVGNTEFVEYDMDQGIWVFYSAVAE
ncbi:hypothetical protein AMAG_17750 [Allomyces macrogynus ATCC 38327]|uniref:Peptidase S59 domain-containing protein n=1 Tax=Allomyces macrogynus (strain ATCC 38327) TaxID=578462 RepID=A0A0L0RYN3_ALLM3|nr:hypothetical protein AMAG_17750 [Allomyces macrogynus ATCC 38327]|eukprot:KNE55191.1 hypothetical protein AMAG_17750 [Allomyces macrogynus ATCC 38327]